MYFELVGRIIVNLVLLPTDDPAKFAQLYICDIANEVTNRIKAPGFSGKQATNSRIITTLIAMFNEFNEPAKVFQMARDKFEDGSLNDVSLRLLEEGIKVGDNIIYQHKVGDCSVDYMEWYQN